jgi:hypothetical protein
METFLFYILRTTIATAVLYLFYKLLLSKNILHNYNRLVILFFYISSLVTAWFTLDLSRIFPEKEKNTFNLTQFEITTNTATAPIHPLTLEINWLKIISILYAIGFLILFTVFFVSFTKMVFIILKSKKKQTR